MAAIAVVIFAMVGLAALAVTVLGAIAVRDARAPEGAPAWRRVAVFAGLFACAFPTAGYAIETSADLRLVCGLIAAGAVLLAGWVALGAVRARRGVAGIAVVGTLALAFFALAYGDDIRWAMEPPAELDEDDESWRYEAVEEAEQAPDGDTDDEEVRWSEPESAPN